MTGRSLLPSALFLLVLTACSHPMMKEDEAPVTLQSSPSPTGSPAVGAALPGSAGNSLSASTTTVATPAPTATPIPAPFDSADVKFETDLTVWKKISDSDGIQAYERRAGKNPYGDVVAFRGEALIPAPLTKIATVLDTPELQMEWVDSLKEARIIDKTSDFDSIGYNHTGVPWPFQDRDFVFRAQVKVQVDPPVMLVRMTSVEDPRIPPVSGIVRGSMLISYFYMKELPDHQTKLVIEMAVDPKGAIPLWLVNAAQKRWPSNTLKKLREISTRASLAVSPKIDQYFHKNVSTRGKKK